MFPSFYAWTQTLRTSISAFGLLSVYWALEVWRLVLWFMVFWFVEPGMAALHLLLVSVFVSVSFFYFALVLIIYRCILAFLWSNPPGWLRVGNRGCIFKAWLVMLLATIPSATIAFWDMRVLTIPLRKPLLEFFQETQPTTSMIVFAVLWVICAAYLFHWFSPNRRKKPTV